MELIMPRNEAKKYLREQANRYYKGEISWDDYKNLNIKYTPLDLTAYVIKPETEKWVNALFDEEDKDRKGNYMLRGFTRMEGKEVALLHLSYGDYSDSINFWAYNDDEMFIYTFCEGDTTLKPFSTREAYEAEKAETLRWYKEER